MTMMTTMMTMLLVMTVGGDDSCHVVLLKIDSIGTMLPLPDSIAILLQKVY